LGGREVRKQGRNCLPFFQANRWRKGVKTCAEKGEKKGFGIATSKGWAKKKDFLLGVGLKKARVEKGVRRKSSRAGSGVHSKSGGHPARSRENDISDSKEDATQTLPFTSISQRKLGERPCHTGFATFTKGVETWSKEKREETLQRKWEFSYRRRNIEWLWTVQKRRWGVWGKEKKNNVFDLHGWDGCGGGISLTCAKGCLTPVEEDWGPRFVGNGKETGGKRIPLRE